MCGDSRYPEHSREGKTWAPLALALLTTCPGREGWLEEDLIGPSKPGGQGRGPSMPVSKGQTEEKEEDLGRHVFKSQPLRLLSSFGGRVGGKLGAAKQLEERLMERREKARPGPPLTKTGTPFIIVFS